MPAGPGDHPSLGSPEWRLVPQRPDWDEAYLAALADDEDPGDPDEYEDPDNAPPAGLDDQELAAMIAEAREITADQARVAEAAARLGHTAVLAAVGAVAAGRRARGFPHDFLASADFIFGGMSDRLDLPSGRSRHG
jgi:hypothetical protein